MFQPMLMHNILLGMMNVNKVHNNNDNAIYFLFFLLQRYLWLTGSCVHLNSLILPLKTSMYDLLMGTDHHLCLEFP